MCGIFGCVGDISEKKAWECISRISHRGPDDLQVRCLEGVTLAHARLSIIDISNEANQPMQSFDGRYTIVFNGEIYNYIEIRRDLEQKGYKFRTNSDTEVLLNAYIEWKENFLDRCNGMWALAIWDNKKHSLFISRDRFGIKPLFYYINNGKFYFASEMKAFFPIMDQKCINYKIFDKKDYFGYEATEDCVIVGIKHFPAGTWGVYEEGHLSQYKWWNTLDHILEIPQDYNEQVEYFRETFIDACAIRMRSDVPIGTALSGGVDSSTVAGAMNYIANYGDENMCQDWQHVYVASLPGIGFDETQAASEAASHIGLEVNKVMITPNVGVDELMRYLYMCEEPYTTSPVIFLQTYKAINDSGVKVTLDGHGADELFGGYGFDLFPACIDAGIGSKEFDEIVNTFNGMAPVYNRINNVEAIKRMVSYVKNNRDFIMKNRDLERLDELNKCLYMETHYKTLPTILRCYDRYSMANGLEIRMPFMDYRIVSFAFSIPWTFKIRNGYTKAIIRDMARPFMSNKILDTKLKIGFNSPMTEWFRGELREFLLDTINSQDFRECSLVDPLDVCVDVNEFIHGKEVRFQDGERIWTKIVPYLWKKAVIDCA